MPSSKKNHVHFLYSCRYVPQKMLRRKIAHNCQAGNEINDNEMIWYCCRFNLLEWASLSLWVILEALGVEILAAHSEKEKKHLESSVISQIQLEKRTRTHLRTNKTKG